MKVKVKIKKNEGITLLVLVVTIIVILILSTITINMLTGENGIIKNTEKAKEATEIADEKEIVQRATVNAMGKNKYGDLKQSELEKQLNEEQEGKTEVTDVGDEFEILFKESNRYYTVDKDGNISEPQEILKDNYPGDITKGGMLDGSEEKPYEINCIEDLVVLSNMCNGSGVKFENGKAMDITTNDSFSGKKIILKRDLNFKSKYSYINSERTDFGDINGNNDDGNTLITELTNGTGFNPIGQFRTEFQGDFDGKNNKILNLYEKDAGDRMGLFGCIANASVKNLYIQGKIEANTGSTVGGLAGGGAGGSEINIINCVMNIDINSKLQQTAGFLGNTWSAKLITFTNCINKGNINITQGVTGGFIGTIENDVNIYNSCNLGNVKATGDLGNVGALSGLIGSIYSGDLSVINSFNIGNIESEENGKRAGIIGNVERASGVIRIKNIYNFGKISGELANWIAGKGALIGYTTNATLTIDDGFYIEGTADSAVYKTADSEYGVTKLESLKYSELVQKLNKFIDEGENSDWKKWKLGEKGYPEIE